jgi:hypothetical protein
VAAALLASACGTNQGSERPPRPTVRAGEFGAPDCFLRRSVQNFQVLDDRNLIIFAPGKADAYHVQVSPPVVELRFANALAFESRNSRVCGYAGDEVLVGDSGREFSRISVMAVYRLDARALDGLQARFGQAPVPGKPEPQPGEGAELERDLGSPESE